MNVGPGVKALALAVMLLAVGASGVAWWSAGKADRALAARLQDRAEVGPGPQLACRRNDGRQLVLLVLGQSNAGNHGAEDERSPHDRAPSVTVYNGAACQRSSDPLAGGTGRHQSIWSRLEAEFARRSAPVEVVVALLAVDSTSIDDWTRVGSPLQAELSSLLKGLSRQALKPDLVLWQQGESDARQRTSRDDYRLRFERLLRHLREAGVTAPVLMARSTRCRNDNGASVRQAQDQLVERHTDLRIGPDTDALAGPLRVQDCHLTSSGLEAAAAAWVDALLPSLKPS